MMEEKGGVLRIEADSKAWQNCNFHLRVRFERPLGCQRRTASCINDIGTKPNISGALPPCIKYFRFPCANPNALRFRCLYKEVLEDICGSNMCWLFAVWLVSLFQWFAGTNLSNVANDLRDQKGIKIKPS